MLIKKVAGRILRGLLPLCLLPALLWLLPVMPQAMAFEQVAASLQEPAFTVARNPVEQGLDELNLEGAGDKAEGIADEAIGKKQRAVGKVTGQTEGAIREAQGQAKQAIGGAKGRLDNAGDKAESAAESFINKVKDIFD